MADTGYTPTTGEVSSAYCVMKADEAEDQSKGNRLMVAVFSVLEFNRWLIKHDKKVAAQALRSEASVQIPDPRRAGLLKFLHNSTTRERLAIAADELEAVVVKAEADAVTGFPLSAYDKNMVG